MNLLTASVVYFLVATNAAPTGTWWSGEGDVPWKVRNVPGHISRFDFPWRVPERVRLPTLNESHNRVLYSPLRQGHGAGLGHAMGTVNADITTALRFNLTYSHRIAEYGYYALPFSAASKPTEEEEPFLHAGAVEQLFGWGVGEIPREHVQQSICPQAELAGLSGRHCRVCSQQDLLKRKVEMRIKTQNASTMGEFYYRVPVDRVVEIPLELSYFYQHPLTHVLSNANDIPDPRIEDFLRQNSKPNTVFMMPTSYCNRSPACSIGTLTQRAFFFHKYWDAHSAIGRTIASRKYQNDTFMEFKSRITNNNRAIPRLGSRLIKRLREDRINIAVHARRGDFFFVNRTMIPMATISRVIRQVVAEVILPNDSTDKDDKFSKLPISVMIYTEGTHKDSKNGSRLVLGGHDVSKMNREFVDDDGTVLTTQDVTKMLRNTSLDSYGDVFGRGLDVSLRIAENTILSIHEMIAADIFIGSESALSKNIVASSSRAAFLLLPNTGRADWGRIFAFFKSGELTPPSISEMREVWKTFVSAHRHTIEQALHYRSVRKK